MIPYPLRPVKKFPQKINLALPKPPKKQISLHRGEKSAVFSHERWAGAVWTQPKPAKTYDMRRAASGVGRPGKYFFRTNGGEGRGGVAATKNRKNLRHAAGGATSNGRRWVGRCGRNKNPQKPTTCSGAAGGVGRTGEPFFARVGGRKRVTAEAMGCTTSNGRRWAPATKKPSKICGTRPGRWASRRVMVDGGRGGVAATKKQGPDCSKPLEKEKYYEIRSIPSAPYRGGRFRSISKALQGSARHRRR